MTARSNNKYLRNRFMTDYDELVADREGRPIERLEDLYEVLYSLGYLK
jgi:hypothetical protein